MKNTYVWFPILLLSNFLRALLINNVAWYDAIIQTALMVFLMTLVCVRQTASAEVLQKLRSEIKRLKFSEDKKPTQYETFN